MLPGLPEFVKGYLRLPVQLGGATTVHTVIDQVTQPDYATAVGLVLWGTRYAGSGGGNGFSGAFDKLLDNQTAAKFKKWFKSFLP
jgi:cell division protein FtsA